MNFAIHSCFHFRFWMKLGGCHFISLFYMFQFRLDSHFFLEQMPIFNVYFPSFYFL